MVLREQFIGKIVGLKDGGVVVQLSDGTEIVCAGVKELHRKWGFFSVPIGQKVKVSRDIATHSKRSRIIEIIRP